MVNVSLSQSDLSLTDSAPVPVGGDCPSQAVPGFLGMADDLRTRIEALGDQAPRPERARDVHLQARPITLAINASRAVHHHVQAEERALDHVVARLAVAGGEGGQGARVVLDELRETRGRSGGERRRRRRQMKPLR